MSLPSVWPGLKFWYILGVISSPSWLFSLLMMDFFKKISGFVFTFLILTLVLLWFAVNFVVSKHYFSLRRNPKTVRFFPDYERAGKTFGYALLYFGNVGLYYFSEKSVASIFTFLFLALYCLCTLFCIQPYTDFGTIEFLLSASMNQTLSLFGLRSSYSWLVIIACIVIAGIRYQLEPVHPPGSGATSDEDQLKKKDQLNSGQLLPITSKKEDPPPPSVLLKEEPSVGSISSFHVSSEESHWIPPYFICPILQDIMLDPHVAADGFTYELEALRGWLDLGHSTSPMTNLQLPHCNVVPNHALRSAIQEWQQLQRR